jgi:uncharacterized membrane protein YraQ (UPF0718 family)
LKNIIIGMAAVAAGLSALALARGGPALLLEGLTRGGIMLLQLGPLLLLAFATAGLVSVMVSSEQVARWLGKGSGWKGLFIGAIAGALVPGGPYVYFPLAATFLVSGAEIGCIISFVTAKNLWTVSRLPMEVALIGPKITFIRYAVTLVFPVLLGFFADLFFRGHSERIRQSVRRLQKVPEQVGRGAQ